jgi:hypothetical protein
MVGAAASSERASGKLIEETTMERRTIGLVMTLALGLLLLPLTANTQPAVKVPRIGELSSSFPLSEAELLPSPFWQAMRELGWVEGQNITVERR